MLDVCFIHPPASFLRGDRPFAGVFPAEVGTDSYFRHAPLGLLSMAQHLRAHGREARVANLAKRLSEARRAGVAVDLDRELLGLEARVFGISLHWAVHTPGALELAERLRRLHPASRIVLGGMTAAYFAEEVLALCPAADGVLAGECEDAMVALVEAARREPFRPEDVPNLCWRDPGGGGVRRNPVTLPRERRVDYLDHSLCVPGQEPDALVIPILRGCIEDCTFCGGSRSAFRDLFGRPTVVAMEAGEILAQLRRAAERGYPAALLAGDIRGMGRRRADELLDRLAAEELPIALQNELFFMADAPFLDRWARATERGGLRLTLSPECSDRAVRARVSRGKDYANEEVLELARRCEDLRIRLLLCQFFALPGQSRDHVLRDLDFTRAVIEAAPASTGFMQEPMLFVDPGSPIFREPERHGFRISMRTLADIRAALERPYWTGALGYETEWMSRDDLVDTIFDVFAGTSRLHHELGHSTTSQYLFVSRALAAHRRVVEDLRAEGQLGCEGEAAREAVERAIARHLPPEHRGDNNLKDYLAHDRARSRGGRAPLDLPVTADALLGAGVPAAPLADALAASAPAVAGTDDAGGRGGSPLGLPDAVARALERLGALARPPLPGALVSDLAALELALQRSGAIAVPAGAGPLQRAAALRAAALAVARPPRSPSPRALGEGEGFVVALAPASGGAGLEMGAGAGAALGGGGMALPRGSALAAVRALDAVRAEAPKGAAARSPAPPAPTTRVRLAADAAVLDLRYPVYDLARDGPAAVAARPGRYVTLVARGRSFTFQAEAADMLLGLRRGPARPLDLLGGDPGPSGLVELGRFLARLSEAGAIVADGLG